MKLTADAIIAREKISSYLLVRQSRNDKSAFLEKGGYSAANPEVLISSLAAIRDGNEAQSIDVNKFGRYYEIVGILHGPSGIDLSVRTIWMTEHLSGVTKFITLIPIEVINR
jgi:hypothetical protein